MEFWKWTHINKPDCLHIARFQKLQKSSISLHPTVSEPHSIAHKGTKQNYKTFAGMAITATLQ